MGKIKISTNGDLCQLESHLPILKETENNIKQQSKVFDSILRDVMKNKKFRHVLNYFEDHIESAIAVQVEEDKDIREQIDALQCAHEKALDIITEFVPQDQDESNLKEDGSEEEPELFGLCIPVFLIRMSDEEQE
jgi:hypothetical protein